MSDHPDQLARLLVRYFDDDTVCEQKVSEQYPNIDAKATIQAARRWLEDYKRCRVGGTREQVA